MRLPHPIQRFVAPLGTPPKAPRGVPHASATPRTALRGTIGSSTESPNGGGHMRPSHPIHRFVASGTVR
eukprot:7889274-Pyramimonas_sp.AAC.1